MQRSFVVAEAEGLRKFIAIVQGFSTPNQHLPGQLAAFPTYLSCRIGISCVKVASGAFDSALPILVYYSIR